MERKEWLAARKKGIGASDVASILGISPYTTAYQLWLDKISKKINEETNFAMERGNALEPIARAKYELQAGEPFAPRMVENVQFPYLRATLDGANESLTKIIEIKYVGAGFKKECPPHYNCQMQFQMCVTGIMNCDWVQINDAKEILVTPAVPDEKYMQEIVNAVHQFWNHNVLKRIPPPLCKHDTIQIKDKTWVGKFKKLKKLQTDIDKLSSAYEELKKTIQLDKHGYECAGVKIGYVERGGTIDYGKIPELSGVDLEQYRKKPSFYHKWSI